ncbi:MAG: hypothetical protein M3Y71_18895 [Actinomycetota bacterium]|nr:hypothetical protein [Actinomycetota bacterium]
MTPDATRGHRRPRPPVRTPPARGSRLPAVRGAAGVALALVVTVLGACSSGTPTGGGTVTVTPTVVVTPTPTPSSSSTTTRLVPPVTYEEGLQHLQTGTPDPANPTVFTSPTGNIVCTIVAGGKVRGCELQKGRIAPPTPTFCAGAAGGATDIGRVQFATSGPVAVCNKDTVGAAGAPVLDYGSRVQSGSVGCVSESIGMTCVDASSGKGFFLARDTFFIF